MVFPLLSSNLKTSPHGSCHFEASPPRTIAQRPRKMRYRLGFLRRSKPISAFFTKKTWDFSFSWDAGNPAYNLLYIIYTCTYIYTYHTHHIYPADIFGRPLCLSPTSWSSSCPRIPIFRSSSVRVRNSAGWKIVGFFLQTNLPFQNDHHFCSQKGTPSFFKIRFCSVEPCCASRKQIPLSTFG